MKNFIKMLLSCLFIFLYCGCSINYNLTVTNNKKIIENAIVIDSNDTILKYNNSVLDFLTNQQSGIKEIGYDVDIINGDVESGLIITNKYDNFNSYINSDSSSNTADGFNIAAYDVVLDVASNNVVNVTENIKKLFEKANTTYNNGLFTFETSGEYYRNDVFSVDLSKHFLYNLDEINVNIKFYNVVESHNADKVDEANNIYTWVLKKDDSYRNISFKLQDKIRYDVMSKELFKRYKLLFVVIIVIIILIVFGIFKLMNIIKQNNKI